MRVLKLMDADDATIRNVLKKYKDNSREDTLTSLECYKLVRFKGYSIKEVAVKVTLSRSAVYRRVKKVDEFVRNELSKK